MMALNGLEGVISVGCRLVRRVADDQEPDSKEGGERSEFKCVRMQSVNEDL